MKVVILGAAGKLGQRVVASCLARGHEVTAAVREPDQFEWPANTSSSAILRVLPLDAMKPSSVEAALAGQDAAISAAGNVADGQRFVDVFDRIASAAERILGSERRLWLLAGAAILDIPQTGRIGLGLPFVPALYRPHLENWRRLQRSTLDWALMCPGAMIADDAMPIAGLLTVSVDTLPYPVGRWVHYAPPIALSLMMKRNLTRLNVPYRGVAEIIADNLEPGEAFSRRRAGIGWRRTDG